MTKIYIRHKSNILLIPVTPPEIHVKSDAKITTYDTVDGGEITHIGKRKLQEVSWECFFPAFHAPYVLNTSMYGMEYVWAIEKMRDSREPLQLTIPELGISMQAAIASFPWSQRRGKDIFYSMTLSQYRGVEG